MTDGAPARKLAKTGGRECEGSVNKTMTFGYDSDTTTGPADVAPDDIVLPADSLREAACRDARFIPGHPASLPTTLLGSLEFFEDLGSAEKRGSFIRLLRHTFQDYAVTSEATGRLALQDPISTDVALLDMFDSMLRQVNHQSFNEGLVVQLAERAMRRNEEAIVDPEEMEDGYDDSTIIHLPANAISGFTPHLPTTSEGIADACERAGVLMRGGELELWSIASRVFPRVKPVMAKATGLGVPELDPKKREHRIRRTVSTAYKSALESAVTTPMFLMDLRERDDGGIRAVIYEATKHPQIRVVNFSGTTGCSCPSLKQACAHRLWLCLAVFRTPASDPVLLQRGLLRSELVALARRRLIRVLLGRQTLLPVLCKTLDSTKATPLVPLNDCIVCQRPTARGARPATAVRTERLWWCTRGCGTPVHAMCVRLWNNVRRKYLHRFTDRCPTCRTPITAPEFRLRGSAVEATGDPMVLHRGGASDVETESDEADDGDEEASSHPAAGTSLPSTDAQTKSDLLRQEQQLQHTLHSMRRGAARPTDAQHSTHVDPMQQPTPPPMYMPYPGAPPLPMMPPYLHPPAMPPFAMPSYPTISSVTSTFGPQPPTAHGAPPPGPMQIPPSFAMHPLDPRDQAARQALAAAGIPQFHQYGPTHTF